MRVLKLALSIVLLLTILSISIVVVCDESRRIYVPEVSPSEMLASKKWKTTIVKDDKGNNVTSKNMNFVGDTEYKMDGTYIFTSFDGAIRSIGDWSLSADGKKRFLIEKNENKSNKAQVANIVNVDKLTSSNFAFSVIENGQKLTIEHVPL